IRLPAQKTNTTATMNVKGVNQRIRLNHLRIVPSLPREGGSLLSSVILPEQALNGNEGTFMKLTRPRVCSGADALVGLRLHCVRSRRGVGNTQASFCHNA